MTQRSGSYPLMNLAQDFGVDYGDVLLVLEMFKFVNGFTPEPRPNAPLSFRQHQEAWRRCEVALGNRRQRELNLAVNAHIERRWGAWWKPRGVA